MERVTFVLVFTTYVQIISFYVIKFRSFFIFYPVPQLLYIYPENRKNLSMVFGWTCTKQTLKKIVKILQTPVQTITRFSPLLISVLPLDKSDETYFGPEIGHTLVLVFCEISQRTTTGIEETLFWFVTCNMLAKFQRLVPQVQLDKGKHWKLNFGVWSVSVQNIYFFFSVFSLNTTDIDKGKVCNCSHRFSRRLVKISASNS